MWTSGRYHSNAWGIWRSYLDVQEISGIRRVQKLIQRSSMVVFSDANVDGPSLCYGWQLGWLLLQLLCWASSIPIYGKSLGGKKRSWQKPQSVFQSDFRILLFLILDLFGIGAWFPLGNNHDYNPTNFRAAEKFIPILTSPEAIWKLASWGDRKNLDRYRKDPLPERIIKFIEEACSFQF